MSQPSNEEFQAPAAPPTRLFFGRFGETSLVLLGIFMLAGWVSGMAVRSVNRDEAIDANVAFIFGLAVIAVCVGIGFAGVVYGVLALFGLGNPRANNDRLQGGIGAAVCFLLTSGLVLAQFLAGGLRFEMSEKSVPWPFQHESTGFVLNQPAQYWMLNVGPDATKFDENAIAASVGPAKGSEVPHILLVLAGQIPGIDSNALDLQRVGEQLAADSRLKNKTIERVKTAELDSAPAVTYVLSGEVPTRGEIRQFYATVFRGETCLQLLLVTDKSDASGEEMFDAILRSVEFH